MTQPLTSRASQRRESVSVAIGRHWPGVAALLVSCIDVAAIVNIPPMVSSADSLGERTHGARYHG
jgi:hypothetical protein